MDHREKLKEVFGYDAYRPGQEELINAILSGRDTLGIMPTGAGKSICFQIPSLMMNGLTLVISPLISLMYDQVMALKDQGVRAAFLNSSLTPNAQRVVLERAANNAYEIMYVAPERLSAPSFRAFTQHYPIPMVTVDEAHCISQWGHNFRKDYLQIKPFIDTFPKRPVISAFTATAAEPVREDIIRSLELQDPYVRVNGFDRPNLYFEVIRDGDKDDETLRFVRRHRNKSGIIYCSTRRAVEEVCEMLNNEGIAATRYHAGLDESERSQNQKDFLYDRAPVMVATNAFGMGIDKSNVSFVLHYNMPKNLESYYQEAGRAGRDGSPAECLMLYNPRDVYTNEFLIQKSLDDAPNLSVEMREEMKTHEMDLLRQMTFYACSTDCFRGIILNYFGEEAPIYCGHCGNCLTAFDELELSKEMRAVLGVVWELSAQQRSFGRTTLTQILRGSRSEGITRYNLERLEHYGILSQYTVKRVMQFWNLAMTQEWIQRGNEEYPLIHLSQKGLAFLKSTETFTTRLPREKQEEKAAKQERVLLSAQNADQRLYERLRKLRKDIADEEGVPPYRIFSNETLTDMSMRKPINSISFREVKGVGRRKMENYSKRFISAIRDYLNGK